MKPYQKHMTIEELAMDIWRNLEIPRGRPKNEDLFKFFPKDKDMTKKYVRNWKAFEEAQKNERRWFLELLCRLVDLIELKEEKKRGRPRIPFKDMLKVLTIKTYTGLSARRLNGELEIMKMLGVIKIIPQRTSINDYMRKQEISKIAQSLVLNSASYLKDYETSFAVDSSGFGLPHFDDYSKVRSIKEKSRSYAKVHIFTGIKTNIVSGIEVTKGREHDSPSFKEVFNQTRDNFKIKEVSGDSAYCSWKNFNLVAGIGAKPYFKFKKNNNPHAKTRGSALRNSILREFKKNPKPYLERYHLRSNVESTFSMVKRKLNRFVRSKTFEGQRSESFFKFFCHNLLVLINSIYKFGIGILKS